MRAIEWRAWLLVAAFSLVLFLITAGTYNALGVVLPAMVKQEGWSWTEAGFGYTLLGAATGSSSFLPPMLIKRFSVRTTLLIGAGVMGGGFFCLAETHGALLYFIGCAFCGVGYQSLALIPGTHVIAALFKHRALPFGVYFTGAALGGVAGPVFAAGIMSAAHGDWRVFWVVQTIGAVAMGAFCAAIVPSSGEIAAASARTDAELAEETHAPGHHNVYRTPVDWTLREAARTPQFYILMAAYFGHLLIGATVGAVSISHLTQRGVGMTLAVTMLSVEALMQMAGRTLGGLIGDRVDPRYLLLVSLVALAGGSAALAVAHDAGSLLLYALGSGIGFGLCLLATTVLLLNYYGRQHNLEIFSAICLIGAVSALGPTIAGALRDATGAFVSTFQIFAAVMGVIFVAVLFMRPPKPASATEAVPEASLVETAA
jgi:MFS family permease